MEYKGIKITKRKDKRYQAIVNAADGRRYIYGSTQKECFSKLKEFLDNKESKSDQLLTNRLLTLDVWLNQWLNVYKADLKSKEYYYAIEKHIKGKLTKPMRLISPIELQGAINQVHGTRTRLTVFNILNEAFRTALANNIIKTNPMLTINRPKHERNVGEALSLLEEKHFLQKVENSAMQQLMMFYLYTGVRRSEALSITLQDIDYETNRIHIKGTKTDLSDRYIPIFPMIQEMLSCLTLKKTDKLFDFKPASVTQYFSRLNIGDHKLHDLRHTFATRCLEKGVSMKQVQLWLGHSNYNVTANIYSHINTEFENEESNKLIF